MAVTTIHQLRLLPPLAIGRLGNSPEPMDNYSVVPDPDDPGLPGSPEAAQTVRLLTPAPTLQVDVATGLISGPSLPPAVRFRDDAGRIRPVSPFLEVWAQFAVDGPLEPLTRAHVDELNATVEWRVHVANLKPFRRTGDPNDQVHAVVEWFADHGAKDLRGVSPNFKPNKTIHFGRVQYMDPTSPGFPEIRIRYTPAAGLVFGPRPPAEDPNVSDDVYDASRGGWVGHFDGRPGTPAPTAPGAIYYGHIEGQGNERIWVSNGYLDDACDGIVTVRVRFAASELTAFARISAGPPTFAPDAYHVRTVGDELEQIAMGPIVSGQATAEAIDIVRRAGETVRMMHTAAMNDSLPTRPVSNMARHDLGWGRVREPIFPPGVADHSVVADIHAGVLDRAVNGDFAGIADIQRAHDRAGDLSNKGRGRMPGMMRGSDGLHLALTRRQLNTLRRAGQPIGPTDARFFSAAAGSASITADSARRTPEEQMHVLIDHFFARRLRHLGIEVDDQRTLADLFADKAGLLDYLRTARAKGPRAGSLVDEPLVVPRQPERSALVLLIRTPSHPMNQPLTTDLVGDTGKTGIEIIEEWIRSL